MSDEQTAAARDFESSLDAYPVQARVLRGAARSAAAPDQERGRTSTTSRSRSSPSSISTTSSMMQELNLDIAGEFLVMAATLIHIKSRMLLPRPETAAGDRRRRRRSARRAGAPAARAPEVQGGRRAAARARDAAQRAVDAARRARRGDCRRRRTSPSSKSTCSACWRRSAACSSGRGSARRMLLPPEEISIEVRIEQLLERLSETEACGFEDLFADAASRARTDRHVPGAARDDSPEAGARVPAAPSSAPSVSTSARARRMRRTRFTIPRTSTRHIIARPGPGSRRQTKAQRNERTRTT